MCVISSAVGERKKEQPPDGPPQYHCVQKNLNISLKLPFFIIICIKKYGVNDFFHVV